MSNAGMWLEIRRGKTNFPLRPITGDRFLIGAGSHCHLQLGGEHCPLLHSLLVIDGPLVTLEAVVADPPLLINGDARRAVDLRDGDQVEIGEFEFVFHRVVNAGAPHQAQSAIDGESSVSPTELSVHQLIQRIEDEQEQIDAFELGREGGAAALLEAALQMRAATVPAALSINAYRSETTLTQLTNFLRDQSQRVAEQDAECQRRAAALQESQSALARQIAEMAEMISRWEQTTSSSSQRVSA